MISVAATAQKNLLKMPIGIVMIEEFIIALRAARLFSVLKTNMTRVQGGRVLKRQFEMALLISKRTFPVQWHEQKCSAAAATLI